jgi:uncharacterized membrane protein (Fun14 family)
LRAKEESGLPSTAQGKSGIADRALAGKTRSAMESTTAKPPRAPERTFGAWLREMPRWKKIALIAASATLATGAVLILVGPETATAVTTATGNPTGHTGLQANLMPDNPQVGTGSGVATAATEPAAKGIFRLGFSFIAGFCLGSFVRAAMRVVSIAFGFWLAMTVVLAYYGLVVVDWNAIDAVWNRFCVNVEAEWGNFQTFMTGSLPAAGLAVAGLATGLKRH